MIEQPEPPLKLSAGERESPLWQKLSKYIEKQRDAFRCQNDVPRSEAETAALRGKISFCKDLLNLAKDLPPIDGQL